MRIAVCDDQDVCIDDIISHINRYEEKIGKDFYIDRYNDPKKLLDSLKQVNYNLVYLDIEMEDENGIDIAEKIKEIKPNCMVIFVTAYMKYFHDSFHVSAFQFITKPIQPDLFDVELERAYKAFKALNKSIVFPTTHGNLVLHFHDIVYIETSYREYKVHCPDGYHYGSVKAS
ncbi:MAG: response regulator [Coprobacillus sp.]